MKSLIALTAGVLIASTAAFAQPMSAGRDLMTSVPTSSKTVTDWYKQDVYDPSNSKIGEVMDVLVSPDGSRIVATDGHPDIGAGQFHTVVVWWAKR